MLTVEGEIPDRSRGALRRRKGSVYPGYEIIPRHYPGLKSDMRNQVRFFRLSTRSLEVEHPT